MAAAREGDFVDMALIVNIEEINVRGNASACAIVAPRTSWWPSWAALKASLRRTSRSSPRHASRRASCI